MTKLKIFIVPLACTLLLGWIDPASDKNDEGIQLYNEETYDEAISKFTDAQINEPESESLDFNIANTHYKGGKFPEAEKAYKDALGSEDDTLKAKANYNMGNTLLEKEETVIYKSDMMLKRGSSLTYTSMATLSREQKSA